MPDGSDYVGGTTVNPLAPADYNVLGWLKALYNRMAGGTAGTPSGQINTVQGVSGGTPVPISLAADNYVNITTKTTTAVKAGPGTLGKLVVNKLGTADTVAIYDSLAASGTLVATFTAPLVGTYAFDVTMATGITVVTGGTTAGDYTVTFV